MKYFVKLFVAFLLTMLIVGCGQTEKKKQTTENIKPSKDCVVLAGYRNMAPGEKDAVYCSAILGVWEPLITHDENGLPAPSLATSWEMRNGGKEWIFKLRRGVKFHNGTPFNSNAVIKNFDRMAKGYKRSSFYGMNMKLYYPSLIKYEKLDDYTFRLIFKNANVNQLYKMMDFGSPMYAPECFAEDGNFNGIAQGTGPYKITENVLNRYVKIVRNDEYYGEKAHIPSYVIRVIPNADVRYTALKAGEIWGVVDINAIPPFLADEILRDDRFAVTVNKQSLIRFLYVNSGKFPFNDIRMRQAVSLAIDRKDLVKSLYLDYVEPTNNLLNYVSPYYVQFPIEYNLEKAKRLAREVLGDQRCEIVYCINGAEIMQKGEAELIAYWLKDIGLDVKIQSLEYATMVKVMRKGEYNLGRLQRGLPNGDPYVIFDNFMTPQGATNVGYGMHYENKEIVDLLKEVQHVVDEDKRHALYKKMQEISVVEQPVIPLFNDKTIMAYSKHLKNYNALIYGINLAKVEYVE